MWVQAKLCNNYGEMEEECGAFISDVGPEMQLLKKKWHCQFKIWCDPFSIAFQYVKLNLLHSYDKCLGTILKFSPLPLASHVLWLQQGIKQAQKSDGLQVSDFNFNWQLSGLQLAAYYHPCMDTIAIAGVVNLLSTL